MEETLERGNSAVPRPTRRWVRRGVVSSLALLAAGTLVVWLRPAPELDCEQASRTASDGIAVTVCQGEFERTRLPLTGIRLSDALRRTGNSTAAEALAKDLLGTDLKADALQILGKIASAQDQTDEAIERLQEARQLHRQQGNHVQLARDDQALARVYQDREKYVEALQTIDEGISEARAAADPYTEAYCHLYAAQVLMALGYFEPSHQELDRAAPLFSAPRELAQLWRLRGDLEQQVGRGSVRADHNKQAVAAFERSLAYAQQAQLTSTAASTHLNLAYSLAELGRTDEADRHLAEAGVLDIKRRYEHPRKEIAARIAYHRGNYSLASSLNEQVYSTIKSDDEPIDVCVMQARIAIATHDLDAAVLWAKRGVDHAERIRSAQVLNELRPWVLAIQRAPFELLFTAYALSGRIEDAIVVFDQWQGRTLLDKMARPASDASPALSSTATQVQSLGRWLPAVSKGPLMAYDGRAVAATLRTIDLLGLAVADGRVWRLTANHGRFALDDLGPFDKLRDRIDRFTAKPTDATFAGDLGDVLLPASLVRKTTDPLFVVLDASFAALPFVALRREAQPVIAFRPVLRTPRFPVMSACDVGTDKHGALVLADAAGDLPDARRESSQIASMFGTTPLVGAAATSTALFAAKSDPLLHVAVHAAVDDSGGVLKLHDREVSAAEIAANRLGPSLVVLSACSTARAWDPELAGALSTAFLAGGSKQVVATLRPVSDAGARELTRRFYDERGADGPEGPIRVLARIQAELAKTTNQEWPNFAVYGVCVPPS